MPGMLRTAALAAGLLALGAGSAAAHVPGSLGGGLGAGFAHPLGGLDHLLAMLAVGLWAAQAGGRALWALPAAFLVVMAAAAAVGADGLLGTVPWETGIAASVLVLGALAALRVSLPTVVSVLIVGPLAALHGHAHGLELAAGSALTFGAGFLAATALLHGLGILLGRLPAAGAARAGGGAIAVVGALLLLA